MVDAAVGEAAGIGGRRWRASLWDYAVIVCWLLALTVLGAVVRWWAPPAPAAAPDPVAADVLAFAFTVLPVWAYLTIGEGGRAAAGWGKRRAGLRVTRSHGGRAGYRRVAVRNAVKLLPWQLAHISVARIILGVDAPLVVGVTYGLSLLVPVVSIVMAWRDPRGRALHDRVAGTRVVLAWGPSVRAVRADRSAPTGRARHRRIRVSRGRGGAGRGRTAAG